MSPDSRSPWSAEIALVFVAFIWGSTFVLVKFALADVSTLLFLALRFLLAGLVLTVAYRRRLSGAFAGGALRLRGGLLAGVFLFGGYAFQTFGLRQTTPSKSAFLTGLAIVMVPVIGALVYRVVPRLSEAVGVGIATVGMALMTLDGSDLGVNSGDVLTIVGAVFFAVHLLVVGRYSPRDGFERVSVAQVTMAAALALSTFWWGEEPYIEWSFTVLLALGVTGLFATAAAFTLQAWAQQHTSPTRTALIFALEPIFAWGTSFVVLGEVLPARVALGAALILAGILIVELKPGRRKRHP
ncbi:MAG: DMT family transporter [bacterium]|nr:DMT family transporter [bacterium]